MVTSLIQLSTFSSVSWFVCLRSFILLSDEYGVHKTKTVIFCLTICFSFSISSPLVTSFAAKSHYTTLYFFLSALLIACDGLKLPMRVRLLSYPGAPTSSAISLHGRLATATTCLATSCCCHCCRHASHTTLGRPRSILELMHACMGCLRHPGARSGRDCPDPHPTCPTRGLQSLIAKRS